VSTTALHTSDLEPSLVGARIYVTRRRPMRVDAAIALCFTIALLTLFPARLIVPGMTDLGRPGLVVGLLLFFWWFLARFTTHLTLVGPNPMRWALLVFTISVLVSYAAGYLRGLTTMEANGADRQILFVATLAGVILMTADGVANWHRLRLVLQVLVWCSAFVAVVGLLQYILALDVTKYLIIPGLQSKGEVLGFEQRGGSFRVASTLTHYIELSTYMATVLPFAIHFALFATTKRRRLAFLGAALLIAAAIPATISRTGLLALLVMFLVMFPVWRWRMRYNILAISIGLLAALTVVKPSLVTNQLTLFDDPSQNTGFTVRQERYPLVFHYFAQRPWLGRGTGTYIPPQYQILDNYWLSYLVSNGALGVAALGALMITAVVLAVIALRRSSSIEDKHLCGAAIATQVIAIVSGGTFDSLAFTTYAMIWALCIGVCAAVWRLTHPARMVRTSAPRWFAFRPKREPKLEL
jgi:polysaccharide biosynthesis protein PslJ